MAKIMEFLTEAAGKNLHLEHLEDEILNFGIAGGRSSINFLIASYHHIIIKRMHFVGGYPSAIIGNRLEIVPIITRIIRNFEASIL